MELLKALDHSNKKTEDTVLNNILCFFRYSVHADVTLEFHDFFSKLCIAPFVETIVDGCVLVAVVLCHGG